VEYVLSIAAVVIVSNEEVGRRRRKKKESWDLNESKTDAIRKTFLENHVHRVRSIDQVTDLSLKARFHHKRTCTDLLSPSIYAQSRNRVPPSLRELLSHGITSSDIYRHHPTIPLVRAEEAAPLINYHKTS
jgi:hypothetical protein